MRSMQEDLFVHWHVQSHFASLMCFRSWRTLHSPSSLHRLPRRYCQCEWTVTKANLHDQSDHSVTLKHYRMATMECKATKNNLLKRRKICEYQLFQSSNQKAKRTMQRRSTTYPFQWIRETEVHSAQMFASRKSKCFLRPNSWGIAECETASLWFLWNQMTEPTRLLHRLVTKGTLFDSVQVDRWEENWNR